MGESVDKLIRFTGWTGDIDDDDLYTFLLILFRTSWWIGSPQPQCKIKCLQSYAMIRARRDMHFPRGPNVMLLFLRTAGELDASKRQIIKRDLQNPHSGSSIGFFEIWL